MIRKVTSGRRDDVLGAWAEKTRKFRSGKREGGPRGKVALNVGNPGSFGVSIC